MVSFSGKGLTARPYSHIPGGVLHTLNLKYAQVSGAM